MLQDWSTQNWWDWIAVKAGEYSVFVGITDKNRATTDGWDDFERCEYTINERRKPELKFVGTLNGEPMYEIVQSMFVELKS